MGHGNFAMSCGTSFDEFMFDTYVYRKNTDRYKTAMPRIERVQGNYHTVLQHVENRTESYKKSISRQLEFELHGL